MQRTRTAGGGNEAPASSAKSRVSPEVMWCTAAPAVASPTTPVSERRSALAAMVKR
jgi:hypothetical protein